MKYKLAIALIVLLAMPLAFAQKVNTDYDKTFDFSQIHTFAIVFATPWNNPLQQQRAKEDIGKRLTAAGWKEVPDQSQADAVVAIHGAVNQQKSVDTFYSGGGWGWGGGMAQTNVNTINIGQLVVDILDTHNKKTFFRGTAADELSDKPQKNQEKLDKAIEKMFKDFPPKGKGD